MTSTEPVRSDSALGGDLRLRGGRVLLQLEVAMLGAGLAGFGLLYCTQPLLPAIGATFGVGPSAASLVVSLATGGLALGVVPLSGLAESFGRARMMRAGLVIACALTVLAATSTTLWELLLLRGLTGLALGGVLAVAMGYLGEEVHPAAVSTAMGIYVSGNTLGGVFGRIVPALTLDVTSWRWAMVVLAGCAAIAAVVFMIALPPPTRDTRRPVRSGGQLHVLLELLRDPGIRRLCLVAFLLMGGFVACYNYLTYRLTAPPISLPSGVAGLLFLAYFAGTITSTVAGRVAYRLGRRRVLCTSAVVSLAGLLLTLPNNLVCITIGLVIFTGGFFGAHSVASGWVSARTALHRSQASALYLLSYYAGSSVLGALVGVGYDVAGWTLTVGLISLLSLAAIAVALGIKEPSTRSLLPRTSM